MGKKKDNIDELEALQIEIRELKTINRALVKQIKRLSKDSGRLDFLEESLKEALIEQEATKKTRKDRRNCPSCGLEGIEEVDLGARCYDQCRNCEWRGRSKVKKTN